MKRVVGLVILLVGCGGTATALEPTDPSSDSDELVVSEPALAEGVAAMTPVCFAAERCDALDSDCDGHIDEGCEGASAAELEIGLAWNDGSSLTVSLEAPTELDDAPEPTACDEVTPLRRERRAATIAQGEYRISVARTETCAAAEGTVASVTVSVLGRALGTYNVPVGGEPAAVVSFSVAPR